MWASVLLVSHYIITFTGGRSNCFDRIYMRVEKLFWPLTHARCKLFWPYTHPWCTTVLTVHTDDRCNTVLTEHTYLLYNCFHRKHISIVKLFWQNTYSYCTTVFTENTCPLYNCSDRTHMSVVQLYWPYTHTRSTTVWPMTIHTCAFSLPAGPEDSCLHGERV